MHTIIHVKIDFDRAKNARNIAVRGLSFGRAADFDFEMAVFPNKRKVRRYEQATQS